MGQGIPGLCCTVLYWTVLPQIGLWAASGTQGLTQASRIAWFALSGLIPFPMELAYLVDHLPPGSQRILNPISGGTSVLKILSPVRLAYMLDPIPDGTIASCRSFVQRGTVYCNVQYCAALCCAVLYGTVLCCIVLCCDVLYGGCNKS